MPTSNQNPISYNLPKELVWLILSYSQPNRFESEIVFLFFLESKMAQEDYYRLINLNDDFPRLRAFRDAADTEELQAYLDIPFCFKRLGKRVNPENTRLYFNILFPLQQIEHGNFLECSKFLDAKTSEPFSIFQFLNAALQNIHDKNQNAYGYFPYAYNDNDDINPLLVNKINQELPLHKMQSDENLHAFIMNSPIRDLLYYAEDKCLPPTWFRCCQAIGGSLFYFFAVIANVIFSAGRAVMYPVVFVFLIIMLGLGGENVPKKIFYDQEQKKYVFDPIILTFAPLFISVLTLPFALILGPARGAYLGWKLSQRFGFDFTDPDKDLWPFLWPSQFTKLKDTWEKSKKWKENISMSIWAKDSGKLSKHAEEILRKNHPPMLKCCVRTQVGS